MNINESPFIISAHHINKKIKSGKLNLEILRDVSLNVAYGESCAIMGVSGSGKSTLLSILAGLDLPTQGEVSLLQHTLTTMSEEQRTILRGKHISFIFQNFYLLPNLTALENVLLPLELMKQPDAYSQAIINLERVGLHQRLHHKSSTLSGGEQQRVAIARAFASQPKLLFADEPIGNLDVRTGAHIVDLLFHLNEERKTTIILTTHDQRIAQRSQSCYVLEDGCLIPSKINKTLD